MTDFASDFIRAATDAADRSRDKEQIEGHSPAEQQIPAPHDMTEVIRLSGAVARCAQELELLNMQLRDAWARVPSDATLVKRPFRSDIRATCRNCGIQTFWRTGRGLAQCFPECKNEAREASRPSSKQSLPQFVWDILTGDSDDPAGSLDDE